MKASRSGAPSDSRTASRRAVRANLLSRGPSRTGSGGEPATTATPYGYITGMSESETIHEYAVAGMTCEHCVRSVTEEVGEVAGVRDVDVDLASGRLVVRGDASDDAVRAAVAAAGYELLHEP